MNTIYGYFCLIFLRKINGFKIRIYNKKTHYEIYITHPMELDIEKKEEIKKILENSNINNYMYGHNNIYFESRPKLKRMNIYKIILEIINALREGNR